MLCPKGPGEPLRVLSKSVTETQSDLHFRKLDVGLF